MKTPRSIRTVALACVLAVTVGCDQASKHLARVFLPELGTISALRNHLTFTLAQNAGGFLGLGATLPTPVRATVLLATAGIGLLASRRLLRNPTTSRVAAFGLWLLWAGGVSNLIDRLLQHGLVTDFILLRVGQFHTGVFNFADLAITLGAVLLAVSLPGRQPNPSLQRTRYARR